MSKIDQAKGILKSLGLPNAQQNEISALTLLALCGIKQRDSWDKATRKSLKVTKGIMAFIKKEYKKAYAPNTRETFRRQVLHQFVQARIVDYNPDKPHLPVNSSNANYAVSEAAQEVIITYKTKLWNPSTKKFLAELSDLAKKYYKERNEH